MDTNRLLDLMARIPPRAAGAAFKLLRALPPVSRAIERRYDSMMGDFEASLRPYRDRVATHTRLPAAGRSRDDILAEMRELAAAERDRWQSGRVSGAVYNGDEEHVRFLDQVYALSSQTNPLHADVWPSVSRYEAEIVAMTAAMLGGGRGSGANETVCGSVSSGGTESILLAMKAYRDQARDKRGIKRPEMVVPVTAHAAFDKAAAYFGIGMKRIPVDAAFKADVAAARDAVGRNTVVVVGSAPSFPHGAVDPIPELAELARRKRVGMHVDACLGGFVLPWAEKLGYQVPTFDFRLPGVTSMSADTHKYGYAAKGTSVVLYRHGELRRYQYYKATDWPGGLYCSPTFAGSRPGALIAACWAAMLSLGEQGYLEATRRILETAAAVKRGVREIPGLYVLGEPLFDIAFASRELDIYRVMDRMTQRGWSLNGLQRPAAVHLCVTLRHTQPGVAQRFLDDLSESVREVRVSPGDGGGMAPVYGLAAAIPVRAVVGDILERYMDALYEV